MVDELIRNLTRHQIPEFVEANPEFDLLKFDFWDPEARRSLSGDPQRVSSQLDALRAYQRIARLFPHNNVAFAAVGFENCADALIGAGFSSAHEIASYSKDGFAQAAGDALDRNEALAHSIHRRAVQIKGAVRHIFANARDVAGSVHTRSMLAEVADPQLISYLTSVPSFQTLLGSLDYIEVPDTISIFSPAAYFLDLLRINSRYIDYYTSEKVPSNSLAGRRLDLFEMKIDADNTTRLVPYVNIVNSVLRKSLQTVDVDPVRKIALACYPFDMPTVLPLAETDSALAKIDTSLADIAQACSPYRYGTRALDYEEALADLGLSLAQGDALIVRQEGMPISPSYMVSTPQEQTSSRSILAKRSRLGKPQRLRQNASPAITNYSAWAAISKLTERSVASSGLKAKRSRLMSPGRPKELSNSTRSAG